MYIGKTKILLHNVNTGKDEKVEHGNVFRGENIQKYLRTYGCFKNSFSASVPLWQEVVGGIMLFDGTIPTDSGLIPAGHGMTANGAYNVTNNSTPIEFGTWNALESSVSADGNTITMVYDWDTSHGNGDIASVCLTSYEAGQIGLGNASEESRSSGCNFATRRLPTANSTNSSFYSHNRKIVLSKTSGEVYTFQITDLWGTHAVLDQAVYTKDVTLVSNPSSTIRATFLLQLSEDKLLVLRSADSSAVPNNQTLYIDEINLNSWQVTDRSVVNATGYIVGGGMNGFGKGWGALSDHEIFISNRGITASNEAQNYVLDLSTGSFAQCGWGHVTSYNDYHNIYRLNDDLYVLPPTYSDGYIRIWDRVKGTTRKVNASGLGWWYQAVQDNTVGGVLTNFGQIAVNPFYLATINNLEEPVTKDVSKTMKVIYTLTKAS